MKQRNKNYYVFLLKYLRRLNKHNFCIDNFFCFSKRIYEFLGSFTQKKKKRKHRWRIMFNVVILAKLKKIFFEIFLFEIATLSRREIGSYLLNIAKTFSIFGHS